MEYKQALKAFGNITALYIEALGMQAENMQCQTLDRSLAYGDAQFFLLSDKIGRILKGIKLTTKEMEKVKKVISELLNNEYAPGAKFGEKGHIDFGGIQVGQYNIYEIKDMLENALSMALDKKLGETK